MLSPPTRSPLQHRALALAALAFLLCPCRPGNAVAQGLADPTRPADARDIGGAAGPQGPVLQSVLISPGRRLAVIDGQTVPLGGRFGAATLVAVTETEVVLKEGRETRHLRLLPAVEKGATAQARGGTRKDRP